MAKVPDTIEGIEAEIEAARAELKVAQDKFNRRFKVLNIKYQALQQARLTVSANLADYLQTYNTMGENSIGYAKLQELARTVWEPTGLTFLGSYWSKTNQYVLKILMRWENRDDKDYITRTVKMVNAVTKHVLPGALGIKDTEEWKVFEIAFSEHQLAKRPDGTWCIVYTRWSKADVRKEGTLREMLQYIMDYMPYGRPEPEEEY